MDLRVHSVEAPERVTEKAPSPRFHWETQVQPQASPSMGAEPHPGLPQPHHSPSHFTPPRTFGVGGALACESGGDTPQTQMPFTPRGPWVPGFPVPRGLCPVS